MKGKQVHGDHEAVESDPTKEFVPTLGAQRPPESISCTRVSSCSRLLIKLSVFFVVAYSYFVKQLKVFHRKP